MMYFSSFSEFVAMGGHAPYVWSAYGAMVLGLSLLIWRQHRRERAWLLQQQRLLKRQQAMQAQQ